MPVCNIQMRCWVDGREQIRKRRRTTLMSNESVSLPTALSSRSCSRPTVGEEHRQWMVAQTTTTLAILTSKRFEIMSTVVKYSPLMWVDLRTSQTDNIMLTLNSSAFFCGTQAQAQAQAQAPLLTCQNRIEIKSKNKKKWYMPKGWVSRRETSSLL